MAFFKTYNPPPLCKNEILRYAGCKTEDDLPGGLLDECIKEAESVLTYKVCYLPFDIKIAGENCDFGIFSVNSKALAKNLAEAKKAVVFAATVGVGIDRLISKYGALSPSKAVLIGAIGTERIEALCDAFCAETEQVKGLFALPRFSPGYGDFDIQYQREIFRILNCRKHIGLTLGESLIMSPVKSVTAVVGLTNTPRDKKHDKCRACENKDCIYRGV